MCSRTLIAINQSTLHWQRSRYHLHFEMSNRPIREKTLAENSIRPNQHLLFQSIYSSLLSQSMYVGGFHMVVQLQMCRLSF